MKLEGVNGQYLSLAVLGYEFPDCVADSDPFDPNWLIIGGQVGHPKGDWTFQEACLLTFEVEALAAWLEGIATGRVRETTQQFVEPSLLFEVLEDMIRVSFELEVRPSWAERTAVHRDNAVFVELAAHDIEVAAAASSLRNDLSRYPQRGPGLPS